MARVGVLITVCSWQSFGWRNKLAVISAILPAVVCEYTWIGNEMRSNLMIPSRPGPRRTGCQGELFVCSALISWCSWNVQHMYYHEGGYLVSFSRIYHTLSISKYNSPFDTIIVSKMVLHFGTGVYLFWLICMSAILTLLYFRNLKIFNLGFPWYLRSVSIYCKFQSVLVILRCLECLLILVIST